MNTEGYLCTHLCMLALRTLEAQGIPQQEVLRNTSITPQLFEQHDNVISHGQSLVLLSNARSLSTERALGLTMGKALTLSSCGMLGLGMMSSENWGEAMKLSSRYYRALGLLLKAQGYREGNTLRLQVYENNPVGDLYPFLAEEQLSANLSLYRLITGNDLILKEARFAYKKPEYADLYQQVFNCDCYFDCKTSELLCDAEQLLTPALQPYPPAIKACCEYLDRYLPYQTEQNCIEKVKSLLHQAQGGIGMTEVAETMKTSVRSLRRQLREKGSNFQELQKEVRWHQAQEYLCHTNLSLDNIAELLGYSEQSQFSRAFQRWSGTSPGSFREQHRNTD